MAKKKKKTKAKVKLKKRAAKPEAKPLVTSTEPEQTEMDFASDYEDNFENNESII